jgi:hypothetical protein
MRASCHILVVVFRPQDVLTIAGQCHHLENVRIFVVSKKDAGSTCTAKYCTPQNIAVVREYFNAGFCFEHSLTRLYPFGFVANKQIASEWD